MKKLVSGLLIIIATIPALARNRNNNNNRCSVALNVVSIDRSSDVARGDATQRCYTYASMVSGGSVYCGAPVDLGRAGNHRNKWLVPLNITAKANSARQACDYVMGVCSQMAAQSIQNGYIYDSCTTPTPGM